MVLSREIVKRRDRRVNKSSLRIVLRILCNDLVGIDFKLKLTVIKL